MGSSNDREHRPPPAGTLKDEPGPKQRLIRRFRFRSVRMAFFAVTLPLVILVVGGFFALLEVENRRDTVERLERKLDRSLTAFSTTFAAAVEDRDTAMIAARAAPLVVDPDILGIIIYDGDGQILAEFGARAAGDDTTLTGDTPISSFEEAGQRILGRLVLTMSEAGRRAATRDRMLVMAAFAIMLTAAIVFAAQAAFDLVVGRALKELQRAIDSTRLGAPREEVQWSGSDEVGRVIAAFNRMQRRHTAYENALDNARIDLEHRVEQRTSELKRARDEARAANRAKSAFLANMSHELRTPLNAIIGFAEVLKNQKFGPLGDARYSSYAEIVRTSGTHLLDLINDLLDLSKAEAGGLVPADSTIEVDAQIRRAIDMSRAEIEQSALTVEIAVADDVPALRADARLILQLLSNLITNAVKFTRPGGTLTIGATIDADRSVSIFVADTGIGIPADQLEKVLEPFTQLDTRLHREHRGAGLGLPLCRAIAQAHGGQLLIQSAPDEGTCVTVLLPPWRSLQATDRPDNR